MSFMSDAEIEKLRVFISAVQAKPDLLWQPKLDFFRNYLTSMGATKVPPKPQEESPKKEAQEPKKESPKEEPKVPEEPMEEEEEEDEVESEVELDMEGVIEPDNDPAQEMGDENKGELTEEENEAFSNKRSEALAAFSEGEWQKAIDLFTEAIKINPNSSVAFAKRGTCYLKLKKPNACIRDCDRAIQLNNDSAAAHKFRGRAHRLLGNFVKAAKDLRDACKIDFDEQADEWLKEVTPNARKLEEHERKMQRKREEKELKERKKRVAAAQKAREEEAKRQEEEAAAGGGPGGMPSGLEGLFSDPEMMAAMKDPETSAALMDIMQNPMNIMKYQNNPKVLKLMQKLQGLGASMGGGGMPGGMGGMPGGMGGMPGGMGGMPGGMGGMPGGMGMGGMPGGMGGMPGGFPGGDASSRPSQPPPSSSSEAPKPPAPSVDDLD